MFRPQISCQARSVVFLGVFCANMSATGPPFLRFWLPFGHFSAYHWESKNPPLWPPIAHFFVKSLALPA